MNLGNLRRRARSWAPRLAALCVGAAAVLVAAELGLRAAAAAAGWAQSHPGRPRAGGIRILCLGESTTAAVFPFDHSWPAQLQGLLDAESGAAKYEVINRGRIGTITRVIADRLPWLLEVEKPDVVVTMMGVNDGVGADAPSIRAEGKSRLMIVRAWRWAKRELGRRAWLSRMAERARSNAPADDARREEACLSARARHRAAMSQDVCLPVLERRADLQAEAADVQLYRGEALWNAGREALAERAFDGAARARPSEAAEVEAEAAQFLASVGDRAGFERHWKKAWKALPWDDELLQARFEFLDGLGDEEGAVALARGAVRHSPRRGIGHFLLLYAALTRHRLDAAALREGELACAAEPGNARYASVLAAAYASAGLWARADERLEFLRRTQSTSPRGPLTVAAAMQAAAIDAHLGRAEEALRFYRLAVAEEERNKGDIETAAELDLRAGRDAEAGRLYDLLDEESSASFGFEDGAPLSPEERTRAEYARIGRTLRARGVAWIAMQYPLRTLDSLRARTASAPEAVLVENRDNFLEAQRRAPSRRLFIDRFAGDFGHCTRDGDRLLAESAARAVLAATRR